ncbi:hypothetical protein [Actinomadura sp. K4S16]|uniref:hypothetical protein n=1 Tax=Actinomadura sp. K4S16 TaxID=1316147 RepID=UPI00135900EF|nr:hypothetical protein [Actinomadura sp. K4S16]
MESVGRLRPRWAGYAAGAWSVVAVGVALYWAGGGDAGSPSAGTRAAAWVIAAFLGVGGIMAVSSVREVGRQMPRWWPLTGLWAACVLAAAGTFGFVMNALQLVFDGTVDDWPRFGVEVLCAVGAALLAATALAYQRATAGTCARCGRAHAEAGTVRVPAPVSPAPRAVRWAAYAGALGFAPYIAMKTTWALGGSFAGIEGERVVAEFERNGASGLVLTLERYGLDFTTLAALAGVFLLMGLTHEWGQVFPRWAPPLAGRRVPRWLPLAPAWLGALTLGPYGVVGSVAYLLPPVLGLGGLPHDGLISGWSGWTVAACGIGAFAAYGVAVGAAAWSYQRRTLPVCVSPGSPGDGSRGGP